MPVSKDYTIRSIESGQTKCDSRQEMSPEDYFRYVEHFVRFLFMLNKLSRVPSSNGSTDSIHRVSNLQWEYTSNMMIDFDLFFSAVGSYYRQKTSRSSTTQWKTCVRILLEMNKERNITKRFRLKLQTFQLASILTKDDEAIKTLLNLMRDEHQGLLFVKDSELPEYSFIAIEAIWWSIEHGNDIEDERTALSMFQVSRKDNINSHSSFTIHLFVDSF